MKLTGTNLQTIQDKVILFLIVKNIPGGIPSIFCDRYVKSEKKIDMYSTTLKSCAMSEPLLYDEFKFHKNINLEDLINFPDVSVIRVFIEVDIKNPDNIKGKTKCFLFCPAKQLGLRINLVNIWRDEV